jgi:hypothetical protein
MRTFEGLREANLRVIPAQAENEVASRLGWMPAFAGMAE